MTWGWGLGFCCQGGALGSTPKVEGQERDHPPSTEIKPVGSQLEFTLRPLLNSRFGDSLEEGDTALLPRAMPKKGVEPLPSDWKCLGFCPHQGDSILTQIRTATGSRMSHPRTARNCKLLQIKLPTWVGDPPISDDFHQEDAKGPNICFDGEHPKMDGLWGGPLDGELGPCGKSHEQLCETVTE